MSAWDKVISVIGPILTAACVFAGQSPPTQITRAESPAAVEDRSTWRETQWSQHLAAQVDGEAEHRLPDGSRVDILTDNVAWEVEWADKWPESIGQSVFYGMATDREPGVWLLFKPGDDEDYLQCLMVCRKLKIKLRVQQAR